LPRYIRELMTLNLRSLERGPAMKGCRLMHDEDAGNIPVVNGESLSTRSESDSSQLKVSRTSTRGCD